MGPVLRYGLCQFSTLGQRMKRLDVILRWRAGREVRVGRGDDDGAEESGDLRRVMWCGRIEGGICWI